MEKNQSYHDDLFVCHPEMSEEECLREFMRRQPDSVPAVGIDEYLKNAYKNPVDGDPASLAIAPSPTCVHSRAYARVLQCDLPPAGWECRLPRGHIGPCPTYPRSLASDQSSSRSAWWKRLFGDRS